MACNANISSSGYDVQVVGETKLKCGICLMILKNATNGCSKHVFCKACILKHVECRTSINGEVICPGGCRININAKKLVPNEYVDQLVNCLKTKCSNEYCAWQGDLLDFVQVHQANCDYALQSCNIKGCNEKYFKKDVLKHDEICPFKLIKCTYCETDILRMNMEKHIVECLNERVRCMYYDIGCKNKFCRREISSHEVIYQAKHMRLIYQDSKNEVIFLKKENTGMKEESALMKKENETLKNKLKVLETKSTNQATFLIQEVVLMKQESFTMQEEISVIKKESTTLKEASAKLKQEKETLANKLVELETKSTQLAREVKTLMRDLKERKQENLELSGKKRKLNTNEIVPIKNEVIQIMLNEEVSTDVGLNNIDNLKQRLCMISSIQEKVSLLDDDKVMMIKDNHNTLYLNDLSKCYQENDFEYMLDKFDLNDHKNLMIELLNKIPYHSYSYECHGKQRYTLVFPIDLQSIKDVEVLMPGIFSMKVLNNEAMVVILNRQIKASFFFKDKYRKLLKSGEKYSLLQLSGWELLSCSFPHGYAFLHIVL